MLTLGRLEVAAGVYTRAKSRIEGIPGCLQEIARWCLQYCVAADVRQPADQLRLATSATFEGVSADSSTSGISAQHQVRLSHTHTHPSIHHIPAHLSIPLPVLHGL